MTPTKLFCVSAVSLALAFGACKKDEDKKADPVAKKAVEGQEAADTPLAQMESFVNQACECKDMECFAKVGEEAEKSLDNETMEKLAKDEPEKVSLLMKKMSECTDKLIGDVGGEAETEAPAASGSLSKDKEFLGLNLPANGDWKPVWDADAKVAKWEHEDYMSSVWIAIVDKKLDNIEDLKKEASWLAQVGTDIDSVEETQTTDAGWWTIVSADGSRTFLYVRKIEGTQVVCTAEVKESDLGETIKKEEAIKMCESAAFGG